MKLRQRMYENMVECLRRVIKFHNKKTDVHLLLPAFPYEVKTLVNNNLLTVSDGNEVPKIINWYKLTEKGQKIIQYWIDKGYTKLENTLTWENVIHKDTGIKPPMKVEI